MASTQKKKSNKNPDKYLYIFDNKKQFQIVALIAMIVVAMFFSAFFRSYPATLPIADKWAEDTITSSVRSQVTTLVNQEYPNLPNDRKAVLVNEQVQEIINADKATFKQQAESQATYIRSMMQNDAGQTYLLAIDPYYYWLQTENVADHGYGADEIIDGKKIDTHMLAPVGRSQTVTEFHPRLSAFAYKVAKIFNKDAQLMNIFFWIPVLISALAVIPAFFIGRKKAGNLGGFIAAMLVATSTVFLGRTAAGFSDTDAYNVFFPLLIFWLFIEAFEAKDLKKQLIFGSLTGLAMGLFALTWIGWWYIFDFIVVVIITYLLFIIIRSLVQTKDFKKALKLKQLRSAGITTAAFIVSSGIFVSLFKSFKTFVSAPLSAVSFTTIQNAANTNLWPNVFTTVAELNQASLSSIVSQVGGSLYFYLACLGILITLIMVKKPVLKDWLLLAGGAFLYLLLLTKPLLTGNPYVYLFLLILPILAGGIMLLFDNRSIDIKYAIFLAVWFVGTIYAATQGTRFVLLLVPAFAVAFGIFIGELYKLLVNQIKPQVEFNPIWIKTILIVLALVLLINPVRSAHNAALYEVPSMSDAWWSSLTKIKEESAPDAIINSWWDFGHWFKAVADRSVTFDGATQNTPMAHWIGRALATNNSDETIGILRMLDCGSRTGFDTLALKVSGKEKIAEVTPLQFIKTHKLVDELLLMHDVDDAKDFLTENGLSSADADEVLSLTHCSAPENYFITSGDMVSKSGVWGHFGLWDFRKAYVFNELVDESVDVAVPLIEQSFETSEKEARQIYFDVLALDGNQDAANSWISPWPSYVTSSAISCSESEDIVSCTIGSSVGSQNGYNVVLEAAVIPLDNPENTSIRVGLYNPQTGARAQEAYVQPQELILGDGTQTERVAIAESGLGFSLFLHDNNGTYKAVLSAPELIDSVFTKLFFFEGAYTDGFVKFSDQWSSITGSRIIVWEVEWPEI